MSEEERGERLNGRGSKRKEKQYKTVILYYYQQLISESMQSGEKSMLAVEVKICASTAEVNETQERGQIWWRNVKSAPPPTGAVLEHTRVFSNIQKETKVVLNKQ